MSVGLNNLFSNCSMHARKAFVLQAQRYNIFYHAAQKMVAAGSLHVYSNLAS